MITPSARARKRSTAYAIIVLLLVVGRLLVGQSNWVGSAHWHVLMESVAAALAIFVGVLALVRFYSKQKRAYFFIGTGFLGAGLLDAYHAVRIVSINELLASTAVPPQIWEWNPSPVFLSILMVGSWLLWRRNKQPILATPRHYFFVVLVAMASLVILALVPQRPLGATEFIPGGITAVVTAILFFSCTVRLLTQTEPGKAIPLSIGLSLR